MEVAYIMTVPAIAVARDSEHYNPFLSAHEDPRSGASYVDSKQLEELHLAIVKKEE